MMLNKLIGLALLVGFGVGIYYIGRSVEGESNVVATVAAIPNSAATAVAETNLQTAAQVASAYFGEHGSYDGLSSATLIGMSPGLPATIQVKSASATSFCLEDDLRDSVAHLQGPGGTAAAGPCT
jgi:hypothetical protein